MARIRRHYRVSPDRLQVSRASWGLFSVVILAATAWPLGSHAVRTEAGAVRASPLSQVPSYAGYSISPSVPALRVKIVENPATITLGEYSNLTAVDTGGTPWYRYNRTALPVGCLNQNLSSLNCTPSEKGSCTVTVKVTGSTDKNASNTTSLAVTVPSSGASLPFGPYSLLAFAGILGVAAAIATTAVIVYWRRRPPRRTQPVVPVSKNPYVPPESESPSSEALRPA